MAVAPADASARLAERIAQAHGLDAGWVAAQLARAQRLASVRRFIAPPPAGTVKDWSAYRARFVEPRRIRAGVEFWNDNAAWLDAAQTRFGVDPAIVVGIVGVETFYGRMTGTFRVLDALSTLALDFPVDLARRDRSDFFADELGEFLALARREGFDPASVRGSFAGAIGLGQFMPSSIRRWSVDFDRSGGVDMQASAADVIGSIANYLVAHGWRPGMATHFAVRPPTEVADRAALLAPDIEPTFTAAQMGERGAVLDDAGRGFDGPLALVELHNGDAAPSHVAGTRNFWVVTRYNRSSYYALAVIELGRAVAAARAAGGAPPPRR